MTRLLDSARRSIFCLLGSLAVAFSPSSALLAADASSALPAITVVLDDNFPPFSLRDDAGEMQGIVPERWRLWQEHTGITVNLQAMDWAKAQARMRNGEADVIDTISRTPAREKDYDFSTAYANLDVMLFFHQSISGVVDGRSSKGFAIGVKTGDICIEKLRQEGSENLKYYPSYEALAKAAAALEIRVFCMNQRPAEYFLNRLNIDQDFRHTPALYTSQFHWAVRQGNTSLKKLITDGFSRISPDQYRKVDEKWFGASVKPQDFPVYLHYIGYFALLLLIVTGLLFIWTNTLRRRVNQKTAKLSQTLDELEQARLESEHARDRLEADVSRRTADLSAMLKEQQALFDAVSAGIVLMKNRLIFRCNKRMDEMFGYNEGEQIGQSTRIWYVDDASFEIIGQEVYSKISRGEVDSREQQVVRKDGSRFWVRMSGRALDLSDPAKGLVGIITDITAEREAAAALRAAHQEQQAILESATSGIVLIKDRILWRGNHKLHEIFGWPLGQMEGQSTRIWYADEAAWNAGGGEVYKQIWRGEIHCREQELMRRDGTLFWARLRAHAVDLDDHAKGSVWIIDDITVERAATEEMLQARRMAEDATRMKSDFLANMSHEIRTPMNAIMGMAHLAMKTDLTPRQRDYLRKIQASSQHLLGIINDILDFSKMEAGKLLIEHVNFELAQVLDNVAALIVEKTAQKSLELIIHVDRDVPPHLVGDPLRLGQILINYANNAVKFTERGEIDILITVQQQRDGEILLHGAVRDTGVGLTEDQRQQLFQSFHQADSSTTRKYGGSGLGLAISKRLAELMGGEVGVDSELGVGSTFWFTAWLGKGETPVNRLIPHPDVRGLRVLVVDDNDSARDVISDMLRGMTFTVSEVASGAAAINEIARAAAVNTPYEIVFLDWQMPGMDGITAAREIRRLALEKMPHLVMITAYGRDEFLKQVEDSGIENVLIKPINASILFDTVMRVIGAEAPDHVYTTPISPSDLPATDLSSIAGAHILLVEDNDLNQEVAIELLQSAGFQVDLADNGLLAVEKARDHAYDLVLMDMQMPVMDGLTATREIRQLPQCQDLAIIAMTANVMAGDRERCLDAGMNDHLAKPIDPEALWNRLLKWIKPRHHPAAIQPVIATTATLSESIEDLPKNIAGLDVSLGLRQSLKRPALYLSMLRKFVANYQGFANMLLTTLQARQWSTAEREAHTLKGILAQIGATQLRDRLEALESKIRQQDAAAVINQLEESIRPALDELIRQIEAQLPVEVIEAAMTRVDPELLQEVGSLLAELLASGDFAAGLHFEKHASMLRTALGAHFLAIQQALEDYDYATALALLRTAAKDCAINLPSV